MDCIVLHSRGWSRPTFNLVDTVISLGDRDSDLVRFLPNFALEVSCQPLGKDAATWRVIN